MSKRQRTASTSISRSGRKADPVRDEFEELNTWADQKHGIRHVLCKHCVAAHDRDPVRFPAAEQIHGRVETMRRHLKKCIAKLAAAKAYGAGDRPQGHIRCESFDEVAQVNAPAIETVDLTAETNTATGQTNPKIVLKRSIGSYLQKALTPDEKNKFNTLILECVAENDWSFNCIESPSFKRLIQFRNPCLGAALPSAKQLRILFYQCTQVLNMQINSICCTNFKHNVAGLFLC